MQTRGHESAGDRREYLQTFPRGSGPFLFPQLDISGYFLIFSAPAKHSDFNEKCSLKEGTNAHIEVYSIIPVLQQFFFVLAGNSDRLPPISFISASFGSIKYFAAEQPFGLGNSRAD